MRLLTLLLSGLVCVSCGKTSVTGKPDSASPAAPVASSRVSQSPSVLHEQAKPERTPKDKPDDSRSIRNVKLDQFLKAHLAELNPDLAHIDTECGKDQEPIRHQALEQYGDLDSDGEEEALVQGNSCMSGTFGEDFYGVLKLMQDGKVGVLPINETIPKLFKGRPPLEGFRGKFLWKIEKSLLTEQFPVYAEDDPNASPSLGRRKLIFRWDGHQFVFDDMIDVAPE